MFPDATHSVAEKLENGNATRRAVRVASVIVVPMFGEDCIFTNVDESFAFVTAEIVAPESTCLATASKRAAFS